jgi:light-harvesting protein B-800-850 alpha chain
MNQAKIWLVVKPTVGLPLLLGSVTTIAILVHFAVLSHTTWFGGYWQGGKKATAAVAPISAPAQAQASN